MSEFANLSLLELEEIASLGAPLVPTPSSPIERASLAEVIEVDGSRLNPDKYVDIDPGIQALARPRDLALSVLSQRPGQFQVSFHPFKQTDTGPVRSNDLVRVNLTPDVYGLVTRNPEKKAEDATGHVLTSRGKIGSIFTEEAQAASRRGAGHALDKGIEKAEALDAKYVYPNWARSLFLLRVSDFPRFRVRAAERFHSHITNETMFAFEGLIKVVGIRRNWDEATETETRRAIERNLFLDREDNAHLGYWRNLLKLNVQYWGLVHSLMRERIEKSDAIIEDTVGREQPTS